jgi:hypothetical protein
MVGKVREVGQWVVPTTLCRAANICVCGPGGRILGQTHSVYWSVQGEAKQVDISIDADVTRYGLNWVHRQYHIQD